MRFKRPARELATGISGTEQIGDGTVSPRYGRSGN